MYPYLRRVEWCDVLLNSMNRIREVQQVFVVAEFRNQHLLPARLIIVFTTLTISHFVDSLEVPVPPPDGEAGYDGEEEEDDDDDCDDNVLFNHGLGFLIVSRGKLIGSERAVKAMVQQAVFVGN